MDSGSFNLDEYLKEAKLEQFKKNSESWEIQESSKKLQYFTHGFFRFFGKFPPPIASKFIDEYFDKTDEIILDPMVGSGTTLVESNLRNFDAIGTDVNELCVMISKAKTTYIPPKKIHDCIQSFQKFSRNKIHDLEKFIPNDKFLEHWFFKKNINQLGNIRQFIEKQASDENLSNLLKVGLASIIRNVSRASKGMGRMFLDPALEEVDVYQMFNDKIMKYFEVMNNWECKKKSQKIYLRNAKNLPIKDSTIGLTICHPPYYNLYKYSSIFKFEMLWTGVNYLGTKTDEIFEGFKMGNIEGVQKYIFDMEIILNEIKRVLKKRRYCVLMIGDAVIKNTRVNTTSSLLKKVNGFEVEKIIVRIPKFTEASYAAAQRRSKSDVGINMPDHLVILKKL